MEEEDFIQQVAEAIESCMDVDSVVMRDDTRFVWVVMPSGEKFCVAVVKHDADEDDEDEAPDEPEGMFSDGDDEDDDE